MSKFIDYDVLKRCPQDTLFFMTDNPYTLFIKVSTETDKNFNYTSFINLNNSVFFESEINKILEGKFNEIMKKRTYIILEKKDIDDLISTLNYLSKNIALLNNYTLH